MKNLRTLTIASVLALGLGVSSSASADYGDKAVTYYDLQTNYKLQKKLTPEQVQDLRDYFEYQHREPCQDYKNLPEGFYEQRCNVMMKGEAKEKKYVMKQVIRTQREIADYDVHFAFDSADINGDARDILDDVANDITRHNPREVLVVGHTDTAGPKSYNERLSAKRADMVSQALTDMGVKNRVIDKMSKGERDLEVVTSDGVPLKQNRRVEIRFMK